MSFVTNTLLSLHGVVALVAIFIFPALESSVFLGFVFPGETAVLLGGVLAYEHRIPLAAAMAMAIAGAIIGDTVGYWVGREFGRRILDSRSGRLIKKDHVRTAEDFIARRGGFGVFLGRFTAALRAIVPGLAGMSGMRYRTFLVFNIIGGVTWAVAYSLAGYLAGASFRTISSWSSKAGYLLAALLVAGIVAVVVLKRRRTGTGEPALAMEEPAGTLEANGAEEA